MTIPIDLSLAERTALPDSIAYLRATHPSSGWREAANFGQVADFWLHVHRTLRAEGAQLARTTQAFREDRLDPPGFQRAFVSQINRFLGHLDAHHQIEDQSYFPKFRALDTRMAAGFDLLEADHDTIHGALSGSVERAHTLLATLAGPAAARRRAADDYTAAGDRLLALLERHLGDEEDLVIPALLEHGERSVA